MARTTRWVLLVCLGCGATASPTSVALTDDASDPGADSDSDSVRFSS